MSFSSGSFIDTGTSRASVWSYDAVFGPGDVQSSLPAELVSSALILAQHEINCSCFM